LNHQDISEETDEALLQESDIHQAHAESDVCPKFQGTSQKHVGTVEMIRFRSRWLFVDGKFVRVPGIYWVGLKIKVREKWKVKKKNG